MGDFSGHINNSGGNIVIDSRIGNNVTLTAGKSEAFPSSEYEAVIEELQKIQQEFSKTDETISEFAAQLQEAIKAQNKSKILDLVKKLTAGVIGAALKDKLPDRLKQFFQSVMSA